MNKKKLDKDKAARALLSMELGDRKWPPKSTKKDLERKSKPVIRQQVGTVSAEYKA